MQKWLKVSHYSCDSFSISCQCFIMIIFTHTKTSFWHVFNVQPDVTRRIKELYKRSMSAKSRGQSVDADGLNLAENERLSEQAETESLPGKWVGIWEVSLLKTVSGTFSHFSDIWWIQTKILHHTRTTIATYLHFRHLTSIAVKINFLVLRAWRGVYYWKNCFV